MDGGGGDTSELRVNEIRSDILKWINDNGARGLVLPSDISYGEYFDKMTDIMQPKKVVISFTEKEVAVRGTLKTCKGFLSAIDSKPHVLCNISRFKNTSESEQYKLIHHEYAGLVRVENNEGAASDYVVSSQITGFLTKQLVLKLAIKKAPDANANKGICLFTSLYGGEFTKLELLENNKTSGLTNNGTPYSNNLQKGIDVTTQD
jgi:hypothetical protein